MRIRKWEKNNAYCPNFKIEFYTIFYKPRLLYILIVDEAG